MTDYEKGSPGWDIGAILTRHRTVGEVCARVAELRRSVGEPPVVRLDQALSTPCDCGFGDSDAERTSLRV